MIIILHIDVYNFDPIPNNHINEDNYYTTDKTKSIDKDNVQV